MARPPQPVTLELTLRVTYEPSYMPVEALQSVLSLGVCRGVGHGMLGADTELSVDDWSYTIKRILL
jgi:hypothetical protein